MFQASNRRAAVASEEVNEEFGKSNAGSVCASTTFHLISPSADKPERCHDLTACQQTDIPACLLLFSQLSEERRKEVERLPRFVTGRVPLSLSWDPVPPG